MTNTSHRSPRRVAAALGVAACLALAACGDDDGPDAEPTAEPTDTATDEPTATAEPTEPTEEPTVTAEPTAEPTEPTATEPTDATATEEPAGDDVRLDEMTKVSVLLDYFPYGAHAGVYLALENGYYEDNNIDLEVIIPNDPVASLKFVQAGQADIGIAHPIDLVSLVSEDSDYQTFMSLVGGNLEGLAILGDSGITSAKDLEGRKVGTSGSVSHNSMVTAQIEGAGGDPSLVEFVTVGAGFMQFLINGEVDAVAAFKPDVAAAQAAGENVEFLAVGVEGGLRFPSVLVYTNSSTIADRPEVIRAFVDATIKGYLDMLADPQAAAEATIAQTEGLEVDPMVSQIEGIGESFVGPNPTFGYIDPEALQGLADFMLANEFISTAPSADDFVTTEFVPSG